MSDRQGKFKSDPSLALMGKTTEVGLSNPVFYMVGRADSSGSAAGGTVSCCVPYFCAGYSVCNHRGRASGAPWLDHLDSSAVCL